MSWQMKTDFSDGVGFTRSINPALREQLQIELQKNFESVARNSIVQVRMDVNNNEHYEFSYVQARGYPLPDSHIVLEFISAEGSEFVTMPKQAFFP